MNRIKQLRLEKGLTQDKLCKQFNVTQGNLSAWETNRWQPDQETLVRIADYFDVTVDYLLGRTDLPVARVSSESDRERWIDQAGGFPIGKNNIPVYAKIVAGVPLEAQTDIIDYIPTTRRPAEDFFAIRVSGESMRECGITDGSFIVVHKQQTADPGDIVAAIINGSETTVKRFKKVNGQIFLFPENRDFEPMAITRDMGFEILGVVVEVIHRFK